MSAMTLTQSRIRQGVWEGILTGCRTDSPPSLRAYGPVSDLEDPQIVPVPNTEDSWAVSVEIPRAALNEGVQSFFIEDRLNGERLADFTIVAGAPVEDHIAAEVSLLRAELDMLKRVVRLKLSSGE